MVHGGKLITGGRFLFRLYSQKLDRDAMLVLLSGEADDGDTL